MNRTKTNTITTAIVTFAIVGAFAQKGSPEVNGQTNEKRKLFYAADFTKAIDTSEWVAEIEPQPSSSVYAKDGKLLMDTKGGVTVWLKKRLRGNIQIEYKRTVLVEGNSNDRLSDLNQFWMAEDPRNSNLFGRTGSSSRNMILFGCIMLAWAEIQTRQHVSGNIRALEKKLYCRSTKMKAIY
jgi:hypothetical protein